MTMQILTATFKLLTYIGCWRPKSFHSASKKLMYGMFAIFMSLSIHYLTLVQFMSIVSNVSDMSDFSNIFYMFLSMFQSSCKLSCILANRGNLISLMALFTEKQCKPMEDEETKILIKCNRMTRSIMFLYLAMIESSVAYDIFTTITTNLRNKKLPLGTWFPFDYSSEIVYHVVYAHQIFSWIIIALVHVAVDTLFIGLMLHLSCQMTIMDYRLKKIPDHHVDILELCIGHHTLIYQIAATLNDTFATIIFSQFSVSTFTICFSLYQLTNVPMFSIPFIQMTIYISCIFLQIFFYCWYGNEVRLKSRELSDNVFATDWTALGIDQKRTLLMIMKRTVMPIEFTSAKIIKMTLESFVNLLKTSYSVYNLLQQAK